MENELKFGCQLLIFVLENLHDKIQSGLEHWPWNSVTL